MNGTINKKRTIDGSISIGGGGTKDHNILQNRELDNQHPISAITNLQKVLDSKLDSNTALPLIKKALKEKASGLYYDAASELAEKPYWYVTSETNELGQGTKESIISGPYDLGQGGGGGGGITTVEVTQENWPASVAFGSSKTIRISWVSKRGETVQPSVTGTIYVSVNGTQVLVLPKQQQGEIELDIVKFFAIGSNTVQVKILDAYGTTGITIGEIAAVQFELKSNFNSKITYPVEGNTGVKFVYTPFGDAKKTVSFILDGNTIGTQIVDSTGLQQSYNIAASRLSHGAHTLEVYFTANLNGEIVTSNKLKYVILYHMAGNKTPIIASEFESNEQEQYIPFNIPYRIFIEDRNEFNVRYFVDDELYKDGLIVKAGEHFWEYRSDEVGTFKLTIECEGVRKDFFVPVKQSTIDVKPETENLELALNTQGRSNSEPLTDRLIWKDSVNNITCELTDFNWGSDGWMKDDDGNTVLRVTGDARVSIPVKPFLNNFIKAGKTIELEFSTSTIRDYETTIISCFDGLRGFYVTPQIAALKAQSSEISTQYKEDEHVRVAFVIESDVENRIVWMYLNGIASGAILYPTTEDFSQLVPQFITIGSSDATIDIYNIRIYSSSLTSRQVINNWIADTQDIKLKTERYVRNNIFNEQSKIDINKLPANLPYIIWDIDPLPQYKGDKRLGNATFVDNEDPSRSFTSTDATYNVQGTSSSVYPTKNIRIKYKKNKDYPDSNFTWLDDAGESISKFKITKDGIGDNYFTYKVDYASSEGANNVELVKLYNDACIKHGILTPPQMLNKKIRVGIDGFPIVAFSKDAEGTVEFCTKANFNNDKANEAVYGFEEGDESWEITNNTSAVAKFSKGNIDEIIGYTEEGDPKYLWEEAFEIRFPDEDGYGRKPEQIAKLKALTDWTASTNPELATTAPLSTPITFTYTNVVAAEDGSTRTETVTKTFDHDTREYRLTKFKAELADHFNVPSTVFYYVFTHLFLMIDSRAKNAFPTYFKSRQPEDGGDRWFWLPYDMDTAIGIDNKGKLTFDYNLEDIDKLDGADVFNGQDSLMWTNLRTMFTGEITEMYAKLRTEGLISYTETERRFEEHQNKWSESIFNEDSYNKYVVPLSHSDNYLEMLQGGKIEQRKWWLYNRFKYMDSKYTAGEAKADFIQFRAYVEKGEIKPDITITPYADIYATVSYANGKLVSGRAKRGEPIVIKNPYGLDDQETDQETYIYSASQLRSIGDISPFKPDTVKIGNAIRLQDLKVGDASPSYKNEKLTELTIGGNILLKTLDVRNCVNLSMAIDASQCINIEEIYFAGTKIPSILLAEGGPLRELQLPSTTTSLVLKNKQKLEKLSFVTSSTQTSTLWDSLSAIDLENINNNAIISLDGEQLSIVDIVNNINTTTKTKLLGIDLSFDTLSEVQAFYSKLKSLRAYDEGVSVPGAQVTGKIYINDLISYDELAEISAIYPEIVVTAKDVRCRVQFKRYRQVQGSEDFETFYTAYPLAGHTVEDIVENPSRVSSKTEVYTFKNWYVLNGTQKELFDKDSYIITENIEIYPDYMVSDRYYTVNFYKQTDILGITVIPEQITTLYNQLIDEPEITGVPEWLTFSCWHKEDGAHWDFETDRIIEDTDLYARWQEEGNPEIDLQYTGLNTFKAICTDDVGITAWALVTHEGVPSLDEWHTIKPARQLFEYNGTVYEANKYYFWIKDNAMPNEHMATYEFRGNAITKIFDPEAGVLAINMYYKNQLIDTRVALNNATVRIEADIDSHYEKLKLFANGVAIENGSDYNIDSEVIFEASCDPKIYTVKFNVNHVDIKPIPDQHVAYKTRAIEPPAQIAPPEILDHWVIAGTQTKWNFDSPITGNLDLTAVWVEDSTPAQLLIKTSEANAEVTLSYTQTVLGGVSVNWNDGSDEYINNSTNYVTISHVYDTPGEYIIKVKLLTGSYLLGRRGVNVACIMPANLLYNVYFANNMSSFEQYAFANCQNLTNITLSKYISRISAGMFKGTNITSISIPYGVAAIESQAFTICRNLITVNLPDTIESIGSDAFYDCVSLSEINIPKHIKTIDSYAFANTIIDNIYLDGTALGTGVFGGDYGLRKATLINITNTQVTGISQIFGNCVNLEDLTIICDDLKVATNGLFGQCFKLQTIGSLDSDANIKLSIGDTIPANMFAKSEIKNLSLPREITKIGDFAFNECGELSTINIDNVAELGEGAFINCRKLNLDHFPLGLTKIPANCFARCSALHGWQIKPGITGIEISDSVISIGKNAFAYCGAIPNVYLWSPLSEVKITKPADAWFYQGLGSLTIHIQSSISIKDSYERFGEYWDNNTDEAKHEVVNDLL